VEAVVVREEWQGLEELRGVLRGVLSRHCLDESETDDVIQETYLRAARYRSNLTEAKRLRSWTIRIAMNVLADWKRRAQRCLPTAPDDACLQVEGEAGPHEDLEVPFRLDRWQLEKETALGVLTQALGDLDGADQRVLGSFYRGAQSCRETADECDIPPHLVKVRLFRARQRLLRAIRGRLAKRPGVRTTCPV